MVRIKGLKTVYKILSWPDSDGDYRLRYASSGEYKDGYYKPNKLESYFENKWDVTIWGFPCRYTSDDTTVTFYYRNYQYSTTYFGDLQNFININESIVASYFSSKVDIEINGIMKEFTDNFDKTMTKLKDLILPHTKELLLANVIEVFKDNVAKVAELFKDKSIKNTLLNIFRWK